MITCSMKSLLSDTFAGEWGSETGDVLTPVLRTANFNDDGSLDYDSPVYRCIPERKVQAKRMRRGDIILEKSGGTPNRPVGIMAYYDSDNEALCSNFNHILRFDESSVNSFFMFHQLRWLRERGAFAPYTRKTTGLQNLQMKEFVDLALTVPPKAEQDRAAITIRAIDAERNELKGLLNKLDELVKSRFVEVLKNCDCDDCAPLETYTNRVKVGFVGTVGKHYTDSSGIPMVRTTNITAAGLDLTEIKYVTEEFDAKNKKSHLHAGDVIIARHGENGRACVYEGPEAQCLNVVIIEPNPELLLPVCLESLMNSDLVREQIAKKLVGSTQQVVNTKTVASVQVPAIPIGVQKEFAAFVQQVDKLKFVAQQQIDKLQMLYDSLAQEYFSAE